MVRKKKRRKKLRVKKKESPVVIIDTRERKPYSFKPSARKALKTGDYSVSGIEHLVTVERKTKIDAYGSIGSSRKRFVRELRRMEKIAYPAIVVESSIKNFLIPPSRSQLNPKAAMNSLLSWSIEFGVYVFFAGSREIGQNLTLRILQKAWKKREILELVFQQKAMGQDSF